MRREGREKKIGQLGELKQDFVQLKLGLCVTDSSFFSNFSGWEPIYHRLTIQKFRHLQLESLDLRVELGNTSILPIPIRKEKFLPMRRFLARHLLLILLVEWSSAIRKRKAVVLETSLRGEVELVLVLEKSYHSSIGLDIHSALRL